MGVIAMQPRAARMVGPLLLYLCLVACSEPEPPPADLPPPDPGLVVRAIKQTEAAIEVAEDPRWFLVNARGARRQMVLARLEFRLALDAAKAAYDSAPESTTAAYHASVAAYEAGVEHNRLYFNAGSDRTEYEAAKAGRDAAFQAALDAWQEHRHPTTGAQPR